jgi:hypothetical protein
VDIETRRKSIFDVDENGGEFPEKISEFQTDSAVSLIDENQRPPHPTPTKKEP